MIIEVPEWVLWAFFSYLVTFRIPMLLIDIFLARKHVLALRQNNKLREKENQYLASALFMGGVGKRRFERKASKE